MIHRHATFDLAYSNGTRCYDAKGEKRIPNNNSNKQDKSRNQMKFNNNNDGITTTKKNSLPHANCRQKKRNWWAHVSVALQRYKLATLPSPSHSWFRTWKFSMVATNGWKSVWRVFNAASPKMPVDSLLF